MNDAQRLELAEAAERFAELLRASVRGMPEADSGSDLSVVQVGDRLNRKPSTVRAWVERGLFPGAYHLPASGKPDRNGRPRVGAWRIPETAVEAFRNRSTSETAISEWRKRRGKAA